MNRILSIVIFALLLCSSSFGQTKSYRLEGKLVDSSGKGIENLLVSVSPTDQLGYTNKEGYFFFELKGKESYELIFSGLIVETKRIRLYLVRDTFLTEEIQAAQIALSEVEIQAKREQLAMDRMRAVEAGGIYEAKKTEVIKMEKLVANKAANNPRQAFAKVPSLNIWESDQAGLQLDIGGRGLSPKRTSNFNVRQNGYDISADPLGYPESYYSPAFLGVEQVELVKGAGALQYGSQFGGMINYRMKRGATDRPLHFESHNNYGAYNFFNTFNALHGQYKKLNHYSYFQHRSGDGWRDNSEFDQYHFFTSLRYQLNKKLEIGLDFTKMYYLSRQAGGLTDSAFVFTPRSSNRERNWFKVDWNLYAFHVDYTFSPRSKVYSKTFALQANRSSLGLLETPNLPDPMSNRDLIEGDFNNLGHESRWVYQYQLFDELPNTFLLGVRYFQGSTSFRQAFGTAGSDADFSRVDTSFLDRRKSDFSFPNQNIALFNENIIRLSTSLSLVPGFRFEYIDTRSSGFYTNSIRTNSFGDFIEEVIPEEEEKVRRIFMYGLGVSYKWKYQYELYANVTSNYRAINFTDIQIQTSTQLVDPEIADESGYSFDLGFRSLRSSVLQWEGSAFYMLYDNRIGEVIDDGLRVRTNIGAARIYGLELFISLSISQWLSFGEDHDLSIFYNGSINKGYYTEINDRALVGVRTENQLEDLPDYNVKSGIQYAYKKLGASIQYTAMGRQYSDAANTEVPFQGVFGPIPSYEVIDLSVVYQLSEHIQLNASINNLTDEIYFTRRATAYPGPGIIPAQGRVWNVGGVVKF